MYRDTMHITRLFTEVGYREHSAIYNALVDNRYSDGEWAKHKGIETVGDLRRLGHTGLQLLDQSLSAQDIKSFMDAIGVKRRRGRPRKKAA